MNTPLNPPKDWFAHPGSIPTDKRITITPEGRVYGYISLWDTCHAGLPGCVKPPRGSASDYGYAHQGETMTAEGDLIATANIGGGAGHAPLDHGAPPEFYENTSTQLMRVRYGEDQNGLWFSGALWPDVNDLEIARIRASSISGDWRWMGSWRDTGTGYDFAGACFVNIPGYPMANAGDAALSDGEMRNIAASVKSSERFTPPSGVREAMRRGLKWHEDGFSGDGLRPQTVSEARSIANGESQSVDKLTRMRAWFARHQVDRAAKNREKDKPTPGEVAWELWGGDAGKSWSESVMSRVEKSSIAATAMDSNGNIMAMYASAETFKENNMGCDGNCSCGKKDDVAAAAAAEMCACGKVAKSECDCDGANESPVQASADAEALTAGWLPKGMTDGDLADGDFAWLSDAYKAGNEPASTGRKLPYKIKGEVNEAGWRAAWTRAHQEGTDFSGGPSQQEVIAMLEKDKPEGVEIQAAADMPMMNGEDSSMDIGSKLEEIANRIMAIEEMLSQQKAAKMAKRLAE